MATTLKTTHTKSIAADVRTMARDAASTAFYKIAGAAGVDSVEVFNAQGHRFLHWNRWQGHVMCEEPLPPRAANSRHNRRRATA